jgi:glutathione S-transferase
VQGDAVGLSLFETRPDGGGGVEWRARQRHKIEGAITELDRLAGARSSTVGDRFSLGDLAAGHLSVSFEGLGRRSQHSNPASPGIPKHPARLCRRALGGLCLHRPCFDGAPPVFGCDMDGVDVSLR